MAAAPSLCPRHGHRAQPQGTESLRRAYPRLVSPPSPPPAHSVEAAKPRCFSTKWHPTAFTQPRHKHTAYTQHADFIYREIRPPKQFMDTTLTATMVDKDSTWTRFQTVHCIQHQRFPLPLKQQGPQPSYPPHGGGDELILFV